MVARETVDSFGDMIVNHLARSGAVHLVADHLLAGDGDGAGVLVADLQAKLHFGGHYLLATEVGRRPFEDRRIPVAIVAYNVACRSSTTRT